MSSKEAVVCMLLENLRKYKVKSEKVLRKQKIKSEKKKKKALKHSSRMITRNIEKLRKNFSYKNNPKYVETICCRCNSKSMCFLTPCSNTHFYCDLCCGDILRNNEDSRFDCVKCFENISEEYLRRLNSPIVENSLNSIFMQKRLVICVNPLCRSPLSLMNYDFGLYIECSECDTKTCLDCRISSWDDNNCISKTCQQHLDSSKLDYTKLLETKMPYRFEKGEALEMYKWRFCVWCGALNRHYGRACKHNECPSCDKKYCFCCLCKFEKGKYACNGTRKYCGLAPIQKKLD